MQKKTPRGANVKRKTNRDALQIDAISIGARIRDGLTGSLVEVGSEVQSLSALVNVESPPGSSSDADGKPTENAPIADAPIADEPPIDAK